MPLYSAMYKTANPDGDGDIILYASSGIMLASFAILALVGVASGLLPAIRAAKMDLAVAPRHE
jgi:putative ABC transport system permease protein